ncbi:sensor histidine kinase [Marinobacter nauticus]|uniref:histidine kinase n=1 Tax=Marinobacter nauticus TaxID=2743 RepID=A0A1M2UUF6_MARNT|nr:sensor histidine kinase [Marinobacter nauticus]OJS98968.1 two-component sensor histidine kinase [Marinobacter nauticus]
MRTLSLNARVVLITSSSIVISVALILFIAYDRLVRDFEQVLTERQALQTSAVASRVNEELTIRLNALSAFASVLTDGGNLLPLPQLQTMLGRQPTLERLFGGGLLIFDGQNVAVAENRFIPNRLGTSYADRPHFKRAMQARTPIVSRPIIGRTTGLPLLSFLAPIESDDGDLLGLAGGTINLAEVGLLPEDIKTDEGTILKVLDTGNFIQVDAMQKGQPAPDLPNPGEDPLIDAALSGISFGVVTDLSGQQWVYTTQHLDRLGWLFLSAAPYEQAIEPARASFRSFLWISILAMLPLLLITYVVSSAATRQLGGMTQKITRMAADSSSAQRLTTKGPAETRNLAKAFNTLMEEREALDLLKNQFVSNVSHELRTPLTSINGALKLLQSGSTGELPPKASTMVELALRNGQQLQSLITDLLDFEKAVAGKLSVQMHNIDVIDAIEAACAGNQPMARHYSVRIVAESDNSLSVFADPARLRQVLDNFISNAIKHSPVGSTVTVRATSTVSGVVRITVSDQGPGVPEHFLPQLFQRFAQAEAGSNRAKAGTGLGLAICWELAHLMSGKVGYDYSDGAHFWLELPESDHQGEEHL